ncbi:MAG: integration host factor subunit alpha [Desulfobacterales bacterium]|nr:integration host factor subunit alpha [Desulfobacterales bacterium]
MSLTKANIVDSVYRDLGLSKFESAQVIESLLEIIKRTLANGEHVLVSGFGKFCVNEKKERRGRHPQIGKDITVRSRRVVTFRCSRTLRERINGKN